MIHWLKKAAAVCSVAFVAACGGSDPAPGTLAQEATARGFTALVAEADKGAWCPR